MKNLDPDHNLTSQGERQPPTRIYGGIRQDWAELKAQRFDDVYGINFLFLPLYLADFPLSLIGDTVTLPYTASVEAIRSINVCYLPLPTAKSEQP